MTWTTTRDLDVFEAATREFVRGRPVQHTLLLSIASSLRALGPDAYGTDAPWFGWWGRDEEASVGGAFVWTPPRAVVLSPLPAVAAAEPVDALARQRLDIPGVTGCEPTAEAVATAWQRRHGGPVYRAERHRLHRLGELTPAAPAPPGAARPATPADRELLRGWFAAFAADVGGPPPRDTRALDDRIADGRCTLWVAGGRPVAMAGVTRPLFSTVQVAPVYTPPELRGRGYAGAVTAAASRAARSSGATELLLFTDLANPTGNALYRRLGYRPVEDHLRMEFRRAGRPDQAGGGNRGEWGWREHWAGWGWSGHCAAVPRPARRPDARLTGSLRAAAKRLWAGGARQVVGARAVRLAPCPRFGPRSLISPEWLPPGCGMQSGLVRVEAVTVGRRGAGPAVRAGPRTAGRRGCLHGGGGCA
ncbi:hypothetical protein GCM10010211_14020 [Streptomyces albospinus]|uniref:N-acetyltransferase domain-containing protein n=1 Tax=Streptomyces albospinus TaxID=285515 RepID=A0ABQ2UTR5_9ACTN|nr:GNAT family N-acetyltransferase [Streptomyces albospinus]GGU50721.1 hypothetical protein GCM10010211_14020 [Streptomyces albospinus]